MAIRYAVASGNWSDMATWDGGTLPSATDDVHANTFTITIDQSITVNTLRNSSGSGITAGGYFFAIDSNITVVITSSILASYLFGTAALLSLSGNSNITLNCPSIQGGGTSNTNRAIVLNGPFSGTITINANLAATTGYALHHGGTGAAVVNGNITGGNATGSYGVSVSSTGTLVVNGNVIGGSSSGSVGLNLSSGSTTIRGDLRPGSLAAGVAAISSSAVLRYSGHIYCGGMAASTGPNGYFPISGNWTVIEGEEVYVHLYKDANFPSGYGGPQATLTRYGTDSPTEADVRSGVAYGDSDTLTGTMVIPPAAAVHTGVPVDNTVGTAALSLQDFLAGTGTQIAAALTPPEH